MGSYLQLQKTGLGLNRLLWDLVTGWGYVHRSLNMQSGRKMDICHVTFACEEHTAVLLLSSWRVGSVDSSQPRADSWHAQSQFLHICPHLLESCPMCPTVTYIFLQNTDGYFAVCCSGFESEHHVITWLSKIKDINVNFLFSPPWLPTTVPLVLSRTCVLSSSIPCCLLPIMFVFLYHSLASITMCYGWFVAKQILHLTSSLLIMR